MGENSQLCRCENVLLVGVSSRPYINLTEILGMGEHGRAEMGSHTSLAAWEAMCVCTTESPVESENQGNLALAKHQRLSPTLTHICVQGWKISWPVVLEKNLCLNSLADH